MGKRGNGEGSIYFQQSRQRYAAAVSLDGGKRKVFYGKTRQEVAKKLSAALQRKEQGLPFVPERLTLGAWLDYWLEEVVKVEREPTTYAMYEIMVRKHIKPHLGAVRLAKLQPEQVERWLRQLERDGASLETRRSAMVRLRTALNLALKRGHVARNVAILVERPRVTRRKRPAPRIAELRRLLEVIREDRQQTLIYVTLGASLRRGEVLGLHWEDVDLDARTLTVRRRVNRVGKGVGLIVREGAKSDSGVRTVVLPQLVIQALRAHRKRQLQDRLAAGERWKGPDYPEGKATGFIFTSEVGTVLEPRKVDSYFDSVRERAGLDSHTFHGLRHDFAGLLLAAGVPGRVVMEMMGHADYSITANLYQHVPDDLQRLAADQLDAMLSAVAATG
jgi:integrase